MKKQIEEMERDLIDSLEHETLFDVDFYTTSKNLISKGYRKISEVEKWTTREISEGIENIIAEFERLKAVGFKHDDKWRFDNLVSDIRDFMKEYEDERNG